MNVIYVDRLFVLNFAANFLLLTITAKICDTHPKRARIILVSALGGIYALFAALPSLVFLNTLFAKLAIAALMVFVLFGAHRLYIRLLAVFMAVSSALGGIVFAVSLGSDGAFSKPGIKALALSFLISAAVIAVFFSRTAKPVSMARKIHISCFGRSADFTAMTDTGCTLKDPLSGEPAIIICMRDASVLLPKELYRLISSLSPADSLEAMSRTEYGDKFRLLPYSAVGVSAGMLLAIRAEVTIDGKSSPKSLIALSPTDISDGGPYTALIGI